MITIWKTALAVARVQDIQLPQGAEYLHVAAQDNQICIWYRCDDTQPLQPRTISVVGTGHAAPPFIEARHLGSALLAGGSLVFHVFEARQRHGS